MQCSVSPPFTDLHSSLIDAYITGDNHFSEYIREWRSAHPVVMQEISGAVKMSAAPAVYTGAIFVKTRAIHIIECHMPVVGFHPLPVSKT